MTSCAIGPGASIRSGSGDIMRVTITTPGTIKVNGVNYEAKESIAISAGVVTVDGVAQDDTKTKTAAVFNITVEGNVAERIELSSGKIIVKGSVAGNISTAAGEVHVHGRCTGNINTLSGSVSVDAEIRGSVTTMSGAIRQQRRHLLLANQRDLSPARK